MPADKYAKAAATNRERYERLRLGRPNARGGVRFLTSQEIDEWLARLRQLRMPSQPQKNRIRAIIERRGRVCFCGYWDSRSKSSRAG